MTVNAVAEYGNFIKEAFIDPIRSVLIIDDQYPTLEQVLGNQIAQEAHSFPNPEKVLGVINGFRTNSPALIVDVHNGETDDAGEQLARHLHQSDLLILDYKLADNGEKAVVIAQKVLNNNHFNLIVIHTSDGPIEPYEKILLSMLSKCEKLEAEHSSVEAGGEAIADAEEDDASVAEKTLRAVGFQQYADYRNVDHSGLRKMIRGEPPFGDFYQIAKEKDWNPKIMREVFLWALVKFESEKTALFGNHTEPVKWSRFTGSPLWLRTHKGFITFSSKSDDIDLLEELKNALKSWEPSPSRLLSAKLRAVIDDKGVMAEDRALINIHAHSKFYDRLFLEDESLERRAQIDSQIDRKIEHTANVVKKDACNFLEKLVDIDKTSSTGVSSYQAYYRGVDLSNNNVNRTAIKSYNSYVSCFPQAHGWHLAPGHIFKVNDELWICLSPICDLVPSQKNAGIFGEVGNGKPFFAVRLFKKNGVLSSDEIDSNNFIFLSNSEEPDDIDQYGFYEQGSAGAGKSVSPAWSLFIAENKGVFDEAPNAKTFMAAKFSTQKETNGEKTTETLNLNRFSCLLVGQLRYEYALNLIQKFSNELSRVGLGYLGE